MNNVEYSGITVYCQLDSKSDRKGYLASSATVMPNRRIERGTKLAGIKLYENGVLPLDTILDILEYSRRTFFRTLKLWREIGDVVSAPSNIRGRPRVLDYDDLQYLLLLIEQNPDYFLDELLDLVETNRFISVHFSTILRTLERAGVSRKKLRKIAIERDELGRAEYVHRMSQYPPEYLGFLDETSKDERTLARGFGRSKRGRRAAKKEAFKRGRRTSTEALLTLDGIVACKVVEGSMTKELFLEWLEFNVVSTFILLHDSVHIQPNSASQMRPIPWPFQCTSDG
jgi:transposase